MSNAEPFFSIPDNRAIFDRAAIKLRAVIDALPEDEDEKNRYMLNLVGVVFFHIQSTPELFDERCLLNIESLGERYVQSANRISRGSTDERDFLFSTSYRILIEFQLASLNNVSNDLLAVIDRVHDYDYEGVTYGQIRYAEHQMIVNILQRYIHHPKMTDLRSLPAAIERSEQERAQSEQDLGEREARVTELKKKLDTYKTAFNFVGLYDGFKKLRSKKGFEAGVGLVGLFSLGVLMICPFVFKFYLALYPKVELQFDTAFYVSLLGFELVLAFFFRVALHNYRAIKAQLIQIDLRMTLCQFIQDYADYAKVVRKDSPQLLERFDQLIFSGIVNSEAAIPSTFDGLEQIANIIEKLKSK
ncbi:hypothetical protein CUU62_27130 [Pseudomonas sp. WP001]|nr:hypothetical protein CUU62_27130 [Pseudomonas sp. WP001]